MGGPCQQGSYRRLCGSWQRLRCRDNFRKGVILNDCALWEKDTGPDMQIEEGMPGSLTEVLP